MQGTVDRIEENLAVCEMDDRTMQNIPLSVFSTPPKDGDVFEYSENGIATILPEETVKRRETVQSLFQRLKKKS